MLGLRVEVDDRNEKIGLKIREAQLSKVPYMLVVGDKEAADGAVAIDWFHPSNDGSLVAYGLSEGGTENSVLHVMRVDTGEVLSDRIANTRAASVVPEAQPSRRKFTGVSGVRHSCRNGRQA